MARITTLLALTTVLAICQAVPVFIPSAKELIYDYQAVINVGTYDPATYASQFMLNAKLHMQKLDNKHVIMKLSDLTYKLYNGEFTRDHEKDLQPLPLAEEAKDLLKPFTLVYDDHEKIEHIITDKSDHKFSRNMKKGIASLLQLDMEHIKLDTKNSYAFTSYEDNIYGHIPVRYLISPEHDDMVIEKMLELNTVKWVPYMETTEDAKFLENEERGPSAIGTQRKYTITKQENTQIIKEINAYSSVFLAMMMGKVHPQVMLVHQDLHLTQMTPIQTPLTKPEQELEETLKLELGATEDDETLVDLSFGRHKMTMQEYEKLLYSILEDAITHLNLKHLKMDAPELKKTLWMNRLIRIMAMLDIKTLEHLFVTMEEKTGEKDKEMFEVFTQMLPLVGTRASVLVMRNLIRKQKVTDDAAMNMLIQMPFHLRMQSEKLLTELEDMIHLENVTPLIQKTATLTFATMVNKYYSSNLVRTGDMPKTDLLEKYTQKFMDLLKNAKDYTTQFTYMNALYNIRINVLKHLKPYVTGEATTNRHLRYLAMCAVYDEVISDKEKVFELYWPIFTDVTLHLELRTAAYMTIMGTKPVKTKLLNIYWILKNDPCPELYHMHWSFLRSMEFTTDTDFLNYKTTAAEMLNYMRKPMHHTLTGYYMMDYMDPNFGFGSTMSATIMATNTSRAMFMDFYTDIYNLPLQDMALWLKIDGVDPSVIRKTEIQFEYSEKTHMIAEIMKMLLSLKDQSNLHIEYAVLYNNKIIMMDYADHSTLEKLKLDVKTLFNLRDTYLTYEHVTQAVFPNDMGFPTVMEFLMPTMSFNTFDIIDDKDESSVKTGDWKYMGATLYTYGIGFYNPLADVWQVVERVQVNEMISALNFKFTMTKDFKLKLTINKQDDDTMDKFALRNYGTTLVYVYKDLNNLLKKSSKNSQQFTKVSKGENYKQTKMLLEHDCPHTGLLFQIGIFDSEKHITRTHVMELMKDLTQRYYKNYQTMPFGYMLLTLKNTLNYMLLSPEAETFGLMIRTLPSKKYPVNHIDISLRATIDEVIEKDNHLPNTKLNTRFIWTTKSKDNKEIRNWDTNAILDMNPGHTLNHYKIHSSMHAPNEKEFKVCVVGMRKWLNNKLVGHMNISMGHTDDSSTCVDNAGLIEIDMKGEISDEQRNMITKKITYDECLPEHMHEPLLEGLEVDYEEDIECTLKQTSLRKFEYDIKTTGLSETCLNYMHKFADCMKGWLMPFYINEKSNVYVHEGSRKIIVTYPTHDHEVNLEILEPKTRHLFKEMPIWMTSWMGFKPESYHYSSIGTWLYKMGMTESCMIVDHHVYNDNYELTEIAKDDWMEVVNNNPEIPTNHTLHIFVKRMKDTKAMGLRIKMDEKILEIIPEGNLYRITWDNTPLNVTPGSYQDEHIFSIGMMHDKHHTLIMRLYKFKMYIDYDGEQIRMDKLKTDSFVTGMCFVQ